MKEAKPSKYARCVIYCRWAHMMQRCYSEKFQSKNPSYIGCTVCDEWHDFENFKNWMIQQDWQGKQLDKDIISVGNKIYSPDNCVFVSHAVNSFITDHRAARGDLPIGVTLSRSGFRFRAKCRSPFTLRQENIGTFSTHNEAHQAWRKRKHELACRLADLQTDERVASALRLRYA